MSRFTFNAKRILLGVMLLVAVPVSPVEAVAATPERSPQLNKGRGVEELRLEDRYVISAAMGREFKAYHIEAKGEGLRTTNTAQSLTAGFSPEGVEVRTGEGLLRLTLSAWGYGETLRAVEPVRPQAVENRVEYRRGLLTEWYVNGPFGLQQGFSVEAPPPGGGDGERPLRLSLALGGGLRAELDQDQRGLVLHGRDGTEVLQYRGLTVTDSGGRQARSWLEVRGDLVLMNVDDRGMRYPLTIDPFIQSREGVKLTASDGAADDRFGVSVAVSGDVVVVGAYGANGNQGSAYVFVKPVTGQPSMTQTAKLTASDGAAYDLFGCSVAVSGDVVVVGAYGANGEQGSAYVFVKPPGGWATTSAYTAKLTASDGAGSDYFGHSVAVSGDVVVVGAYGDDIGANLGQGSAYVFVKPPGGWATTSAYTAKLTASDGAAGDGFGVSVAVSGGVVVVGAYGDDIGANDAQGSAYVYLSAEVAAGWSHTLGLKADGTVMATGDNTYGQCNVSTWTGIVQVAGGSYHTLGLKADGAVLATGSNGGGRLNVSTWTGIVQVAGGYEHTVGLKADGTVVAVGDNNYGQCEVTGPAWTGIVQVASGYHHTVGLKADGKVVASGRNLERQLNVTGPDWTGIVQVAAFGHHTVGLKADGKVVATGNNNYGQCEVTGPDWTGIVHVASGYHHTVGLKSGGTVVAAGRNDSGQCNVSAWTGIVQVAGGSYHTLGLKADGTVVATGRNVEGQCNVTGWHLGPLSQGMFYVIPSRKGGGAVVYLE